MLNKMSSLWRCLYVVLLLIAVSPLLRAQTAGNRCAVRDSDRSTGCRRPECGSHGHKYGTGQARTSASNGDGTYKFGLAVPLGIIGCSSKPLDSRRWQSLHYGDRD